jgi:hypothetical protein
MNPTSRESRTRMPSAAIYRRITLLKAPPLPYVDISSILSYPRPSANIDNPALKSYIVGVGYIFTRSNKC